MAKFERKTKEERKEEIRLAATQVFLEKGYRNTTMEDVIKQTSLSKGGVYRYYASTKEMMLDIMRFGNSYRMLRLDPIYESLRPNPTKVEICDVFAQMTLDKIFDPNPEKRLYLMFLDEMLYDETFREMYDQMESEGLSLMHEKYIRHISSVEAKKIIGAQKFITRFINGLIVGEELFHGEKVMAERKDYFYRLFFDLYWDIF